MSTTTNTIFGVDLTALPAVVAYNEAEDDLATLAGAIQRAKEGAATVDPSVARLLDLQRQRDTIVDEALKAGVEANTTNIDKLIGAAEKASAAARAEAEEMARAVPRLLAQKSALQERMPALKAAAVQAAHDALIPAFNRQRDAYLATARKLVQDIASLASIGGAMSVLSHRLRGRESGFSGLASTMVGGTRLVLDTGLDGWSLVGVADAVRAQTTAMRHELEAAGIPIGDGDPLHNPLAAIMSERTPTPDPEVRIVVAGQSQPAGQRVVHFAG